MRTPRHRPRPRLVPRFTRAERAIHLTTALLMLVCLMTAAILYNGTFSIAIGNRRIIELIHVGCGFALPVPMLLGLVSVAYRADLRRLNRLGPTDWAWLRSRTRRDGSLPVGKFNAGQKLNAALTAGAIFVLLGTGSLMFFTDLTALWVRTGATLMHDWFAVALGLLIAGHIVFALKDPVARRGMRTGRVPLTWAQAEHGAWAAEFATRDELAESEPPDPLESSAR